MTHPGKGLLELAATPPIMPRLASPGVVNIADLRRLAQRRLPRIAFDYIDYYALLWNNDFSNTAKWLQSDDPLGEAERMGA